MLVEWGKKFRKARKDDLDPKAAQRNRYQRELTINGKA